MAKQAELSKLVTELQRGRMDSLVAWMGKAEAILASLAEPPGSREELVEQCGRKESLLEQLEEHVHDAAAHEEEEVDRRVVEQLHHAYRLLLSFALLVFLL